MKLSCLQENLSQGLNIVSHISDKNTSLPILNNVLIKTENRNIKLVSTNLEIGINCAVRGKVDEEGEITVPARVFNDYVSLLPNDKITMETESDEIKINCNNFATIIKGTPSSDFPLIPSIQKDQTSVYKVKIDEFKKAIAQAIFALAPNEARPEISGVLIKMENKNLTLAATDSFRLAERKIKLLSEAQEEVKAIIPYKTLNELARILSTVSRDDTEMAGEEDYLSIYITENQIMFHCKNIELISRVIDAKYPDYTQIIPQEFKTKAVLDVKTLANSVKAASLFTKTGIYDILLSFDSAQHKIKVSSLNNQVGENKSDIDASIDGEPEELILNYRFLLDGLQNIGSEKIIFKITDKVKPCVLSPISSDGKEINDYLYLIMPIKQ